MERFAPYIPAESIVPVVVDCPAERVGAGHIRQRRTASLLVPHTADGEAFVALFAHTRIGARTTTDIRTAAWRKLCFNSAGAVSAILLRSAPVAMAQSARLTTLMRGIVGESVAVGRAEGALLPATHFTRIGSAVARWKSMREMAPSFVLA